MLGLNIVGAKKGPDSVENGIKWLQDLEQIIIDPTRCPNAAREFNDYEIERIGRKLKGEFLIRIIIRLMQLVMDVKQMY